MSPPRKEATVIDLIEARDRRKVQAWRAKVQGAVQTNKRALAKLFVTGNIYTRQGARAGRNLLAAHQNLLKVQDLLGEIADLDGADGVEELFVEAEALLRRSYELSTRSDRYLASLPR